MSKKEKLIKRLKSRPKDFEFEEAETLLMALGFAKSNKGKTSGSRVRFYKGNFSIDLHKPHPKKDLPVALVNEIVKELERMGLI